MGFLKDFAAGMKAGAREHKSSSGTTESDNLETCLQCGAQVQFDKDGFCPKCLTRPLPSKRISPSPTSGQRQSEGGKASGGGSVFFGMILVGGSIYLFKLFLDIPSEFRRGAAHQLASTIMMLLVGGWMIVRGLLPRKPSEAQQAAGSTGYRPPSPSQSPSQVSTPAPVCLDPRERILGHWVAQSGDSHLFVRGGAMLIITRKARQEFSWEVSECHPPEGSVTLRVSVPSGAAHSCRMSFTPDGKMGMGGQSMVGETTSLLRYIGPEQTPESSQPVKCRRCGLLCSGASVDCDCGYLLFSDANAPDRTEPQQAQTSEGDAGGMGFIGMVIAGLAFFFFRDLSAGKENPIFLIFVLVIAVGGVFLFSKLFRR